MSVGFRPTEEDLRVIEANRREDEKTSDVIRRALRLLDREAWEERARADMHRLRSEDLSAEAEIASTAPVWPVRVACGGAGHLPVVDWRWPVMYLPYACVGDAPDHEAGVRL